MIRFPTIGDLMASTVTKVGGVWRNSDGEECFVVTVHGLCRMGVWARDSESAFQKARMDFTRKRRMPPTQAEVTVRHADDDELIDLFKRRQRRNKGPLPEHGLFDVEDLPTKKDATMTQQHSSTPPPDPLLERRIQNAPVDVGDIAQFDGASYEREADHDRLAAQLVRVKQIMLDHHWHTSVSLVAATGDEWASISARLRDLRKEKHGGYTIAGRRVKEGGGLWEYRLEPDESEGGNADRPT